MAIKFLNSVAVDTDVLFVDTANERVGIGTTTPSQKLEVGLGLSSGSDGIFVKGEFAGGTSFVASKNPFLSLGTSTSAGYTSTIYLGASATATDQDSKIEFNKSNSALSIYYKGQGTYREHVRFGDPGSSTPKSIFFGNVGIGTTSPSAKLQISTTMTSSPTSNIFLDVDGTNTNGGGGSIIFATSASAGSVTSYNAKITGIRAAGGSGGDSQLGFWTTLVSDSVNPQERMTITKEGNIGIGTTSPSEKLHVDGDARVTGAYYDSGNAPGTVNQVLASTATGTSWIDPGTITAEAATLVVIACKNTSGATITKGTPVYQTGNVGATSTIEIAPADALISANKLPAIGVLQTDLNNNGLGNVVITGELTNFTTDPIDGLTPTVGDKVFVKSGGGLTLTKPTGEGNGIQNMGLVGKVSGGNSGSITVSSIMRTNDVPNLPEGRIWVGDGNTIVSDTVFLDETNGRLGIETTNPRTALEVLGKIRVWSGANSHTYVETSSGSNLGSIQGKKNSDNAVRSLALNPLGGNVGINLGAGIIPSEDLQVQGSARIQADSNNFLKITTSQTATTFANSGNGIASPSMSFNTGADTRLTILGINGNVGIGTTSPAYKLEVDNSANAVNNYITVISNNSNNSGVLFRDAGGNRGLIFANPDNDLVFMANGTSEKMRITSSGHVGIGKTSPGQKLDVAGSIRTNSNLYVYNSDLSRQTLRVNAEATTNTGILKLSNGSNWGLLMRGESNNPYIGGYYSGTLSITGFEDSTGTTTSAIKLAQFVFGGTGGGSGYLNLNGDLRVNTNKKIKFQYANSQENGIEWIAGSKISAAITPVDTANFSRTGLGFFTGDFSDGTTNADERMRITRAGNVGIGTTNPNSILHITGANPEFILEDTTNLNRCRIKNNDGNLRFEADYNSQMGNSRHQFFIDGSEKLRINTDGNVGIGTTSPSAKLQVSSTSGWGVFTERGIKDGSTSTYSHNYSAGNAHILGRSTIFESSVTFSTSTATSTTKEYRLNNTSDKLTLASVVGGVTTDNNILVASGANVGIGTASPRAKLDVAGGVKVADDTDTAGANKVGTLRYRYVPGSPKNYSYVDMCMQTGTSSYAWVNIVQNVW